MSGNVIKFSELNTLPDKLLRNLAVAVAHDIDNGAEDKNELLERIIIAVMDKRVGSPGDGESLRPLRPVHQIKSVSPPSRSVPISESSVPGAITWCNLPPPRRRDLEIFKGMFTRSAIIIGALLGTLWLISHG